MVRHKKSATVLPLQKRVLYSATIVLWLTGVIWLALPAVSAPQPFLMKVHGAVAMIFLTVFGTMLFEHVPAGWLQHEHRVSGVPVLGACSLLIVTGWGLYYIGSEGLRFVTHWTHSLLGIFLPVLIYLHVQVKRRTRGLVLEPTQTHDQKLKKEIKK